MVRWGSMTRYVVTVLLPLTLVTILWGIQFGLSKLVALKWVRTRPGFQVIVPQDMPSGFYKKLPTHVLVSSCIEEWASTPWYGRFGLKGWIPQRAYYEYLLETTKLALPNDPKMWQSHYAQDGSLPPASP